MELTVNEIATISKKLDMLWLTLMAIVDKTFTEEEIRALLDELEDVNAKYRGEDVAPPVVLSEPKEVEA